MESLSVIDQKSEVSFLKGYFYTNTWLVFILLCFVDILCLYIQQNIILSDEVFYNTLGEQLTRDRIDDMLYIQEKYIWLNYVFIPFLILIQALFITLCLNTGTLLLDIRTSFGKLFSTTLKAMIVFAFGKIIIVGVLLSLEINTIQDVTSANVFSLLGIIGQDNVPQWSLYPLALINLFEILFWTFLAIGIAMILNKNFKSTLKFIAGTYGVGLLIWTLFVMSLQLGAF